VARADQPAVGSRPYRVPCRLVELVARLRYPLLAAGLASLVVGVWAGLLRLGFGLLSGPADLAALHGSLMVFGFLGTVVALERAMALRLPRGFAAPGRALVGSTLLLAGVRQGVGELVVLIGGCALTGLFVVIVRAHATPSSATLLLATALWVAGAALWLDGYPLLQVVPWWAGFLVLTIVGERLELAALARLTRPGRAVFGALTLLLLAGLALVPADAGSGIRVAGAAGRRSSATRSGSPASTSRGSRCGGGRACLASSPSRSSPARCGSASAGCSGSATAPSSSGRSATRSCTPSSSASSSR